MEQQRIIYILNFLSNNTSKNKKVTLREIQEHLATHEDIRPPSILTLRRDIDRLQTSGNDIRISYGAHNTAYYYLVKKGFTFNEIRFIVDSISINKFLTNSLKQNLIKKFEGICSVDEVRQLISRISLNSQATPSLNLLENLDKVHQIISKNCKINFEYGKYDIKKQICYYDKRRDMIPCKVIFFNERFYLKCMDEKTLKIRTYRIDRMKHIKTGEHTNLKCILPEPQGVVLDMFEPETYSHVKLRIKQFLLDDMLEQFGEYASVLEDDANHLDSVIIRIKVGISQSFYKWVMKYGSNIEILSPESVRTEFIKQLSNVMNLYQQD